MIPKVTFIGAGYVGLVNALGFASNGVKVWVVDNVEKRIEDLKKGISPIYEEEIDEYMKNKEVKENITFTTDMKEALHNTDYVFICVGTPQSENGNADLSAIYAVAEAIGKYMDHQMIVVVKSTVPVGTTQTVNELISAVQTQTDPTGWIDYAVVDNPEFLKEGRAFQDFLDPDRIVIGVDPKDSNTCWKMIDLYKFMGFQRNKIFTCNIPTAEMIKYASNSMLAMRISFANMMADYCEVMGADIEDVMHGVGMDKRIGPDFLKAGIGYGGSCFPKDVTALQYNLEKQGINMSMLEATTKINNYAKHRPFIKLERYMRTVEGRDGLYGGCIVAVWGGAFKEGTDDIRESPILDLFYQAASYARFSNDFNITFNVYDPLAKKNLEHYLELNPKKYINVTINLVNSVAESVKNANAILVLTPTQEHKLIDFESLGKIAKPNTYFLDCRNFFSTGDIMNIVKAGFIYDGIGRDLWWLHNKVK